MTREDQRMFDEALVWAQMAELMPDWHDDFCEVAGAPILTPDDYLAMAEAIRQGGRPTYLH